MTVCGEAAGFTRRYSAATPATCGEAMDVPLKVALAESLVFQAEVMLLPGANKSKHGPQFEKTERSSHEVVEPTVRASVTLAGE